MYAAEILADSVSENGDRLTTFEVTIPRIMLSEFNTHRMLSRNSASSRAIPVSVSIRTVDEDPFVPEVFGSHQKGMVEGDALDEDQQNMARHFWLGAAQAAVDYSAGLEQLNVYKGLANRLLEPFKWHTIIATATDWDNFFTLRTASNAQAEIRKAAGMMLELYRSSTPKTLREGQWHVPLVSQEELASRPASSDEVSTAVFRADYGYWVPVSIGRCARVSFMRHRDGDNPDGDVERHDGLKENRHLSPFEHAARPFSINEWDEVLTLQSVVDLSEESFASVGGAFIDNLTRNMEYAGNLRGWWSARMDVSGQAGQ